MNCRPRTGRLRVNKDKLTAHRGVAMDATIDSEDLVHCIVRWVRLTKSPALFELITAVALTWRVVHLTACLDPIPRRPA